MPKNANQFWTDVDLAKLAKLMKKYPVGTPDRWEIIADVLERLPSEVTKMAKKIKDNAYMVRLSLFEFEDFNSRMDISGAS